LKEPAEATPTGVRLAWLTVLTTLALGGPSVGAAKGGKWILGHPVLAVASFLAYELLLLLIGFTAKVWNDLENRWARRLSERVDRLAINRLSTFERRYRDHTANLNRFVDMQGQSTLGSFTPKFDDIYIDLSLMTRPPHLITSDILENPPQSPTSRHSIWHFMADGHDPIILAILGAPGSGKTTMLRHIARDVRRKRPRGRNLPVLLLLREHAHKISSMTPPSIPELVRDSLGQLAAREPANWLDEQLEAGNCVVLLDGLDEVPTADANRLSSWIRRQVEQYPRNDYVLTSRPYGYNSNPIANATVLQTRPLTQKQVDDLVTNWYLAIERRSTGESGDAVTLRATREAGDLLRRLKAAPTIYELAINPLLLTMIINVHRYQGALPGSRAELYYEICQVMLWRRRDAKRLPNILTGPQKEAILKDLAFRMTTDHARDMKRDDLLGLISLSMTRISTVVSAAEFLEDVESNGLIVERESTMCSFVHPTFQEYLASVFIRENGRVAELTANISDPWWREVALLYVARGDGDGLIEACLRSNSIYDLTLAFDIRDAALEVAAGIHSKLDGMLAEAYEGHPSSDRCRLMTKIVVSRALAPTITLASGLTVCASPLGEEAYKLFLRQNSIFRYQFIDDRSNLVPELRLNRFAAGMWGTAAAAVVTWINEILAPEASYRLLAKSELARSTVPDALGLGGMSIWVAPEGAQRDRLPDIWVPSEVEHPYGLRSGSIEERVAADVEILKLGGELTPGVDLVYSRRVRLALAYLSGVAGALAQYKALRSDGQVGEGVRKILETIRVDPSRASSPAFMTGAIRVIGRARAVPMARRRISIFRLRGSTDPYVEFDREFVASAWKLLEREGQAVRQFARWYGSVGRSAISQAELFQHMMTGGDQNRNLFAQLDEGLIGKMPLRSVVETGRVVATAIVVDSVDRPAASVEALARLLAEPARGLSGVFYPDVMLRSAKSALREVQSQRHDGNDNERIGWAVTCANVVARVVEYIVSGETSLAELDVKYLSAARISALAMLRCTALFDKSERLHNSYLQIAAGLCVFEERAAGEIGVSEVICLAAE
jgi:hypothetical protein